MGFRGVLINGLMGFNFYQWVLENTTRIREVFIFLSFRINPLTNMQPRSTSIFSHIVYINKHTFFMYIYIYIYMKHTVRPLLGDC